MIWAPVSASRLPVGSSAKKYAWMADQGPRDGGPLHFAAGQLARFVLESMAQSDLFEQLRRPFAQAPAGPNQLQTVLLIIIGTITFSSVLSSGSR